MSDTVLVVGPTCCGHGHTDDEVQADSDDDVSRSDYSCGGCGGCGCCCGDDDDDEDDDDDDHNDDDEDEICKKIHTHVLTRQAAFSFFSTKASSEWRAEIQILEEPQLSTLMAHSTMVCADIAGLGQRAIFQTSPFCRSVGQRTCGQRGSHTHHQSSLPVGAYFSDFALFCHVIFYLMYRRGLEKKFVVKLEDFQAKKAVEISDLCYSGYKSFVISVRTPLHVFVIAFDGSALR